MVLVCERAAPSLAASRSARQCTAQQSLCFRQNVACSHLARLNRRYEPDPGRWVAFRCHLYVQCSLAIHCFLVMLMPLDACTNK